MKKINYYLSIFFDALSHPANKRIIFKMKIYL